MTTATTTTTQKNVTIVRLFVLFVLVLVSSSGFAQTTSTTAATTVTTEVSVSKDATIVISTENSVAASMDFAVWFTGVKKTSNTTTNGSFSKKQMINSGIKTNSVLIRSILKKISTQENGVA